MKKILITSSDKVNSVIMQEKQIDRIKSEK